MHKAPALMNDQLDERGSILSCCGPTLQPRRFLLTVIHLIDLLLLLRNNCVDRLYSAADHKSAF